MQSYLLRCKHCHSEYSWGSHDNGSSKEYCPRCQKAIDRALKRIKVKYNPKEKEIFEPMLFPLFEELKEKEEKRKSDGFSWPSIISLYEPYDGFDNMDVVYHNRKRYAIKWNDATPDDKHIYMSFIYDEFKKEYVNRPWMYDESESYTHSRNIMNDMTNMLHSVKAEPLPNPVGQLNYMNLPVEWEIKSDHQWEQIHIQKEHKLKTRNISREGWEIKNDVKYGWYDTTVKVADGIDIEKLLDYVDYQYTYEQYEDENVATITSIKAI